MSKKQEYVSINPADAVSGGWLDEAIVEFNKVRFAIWDYDKGMHQATFIKMDLTKEEDGSEHTQYLRFAADQEFVPSEDGKHLIKVGSRESLIDSTAGMLFLTSAINAGFPSAQLTTSPATMDGLVARLHLVDPPSNWQNMEKDKDGKKKQVLQIAEIIAYPGEKKGGKKGGTGKKGGVKDKESTTTKDSSSAGSPDAEAAAKMFIMKTLAKDSEVAQKDLPTMAFQDETLAKDSELQLAVMDLVFDDKFHEGKPWKLEDGIISKG